MLLIFVYESLCIFLIPNYIELKKKGMFFVVLCYFELNIDLEHHNNTGTCNF